MIQTEQAKAAKKFTDKIITNFIDIYIPSTKVMIEQKSIDKGNREIKNFINASAPLNF